MVRLALAAAVGILLETTAQSASARERSPMHTGRDLFDDGVFDARRYFAGDIRTSSMDELILTIAASARDNYAPAYGLAIAYLCRPTEEDRCSHNYVARMLRIPGGEDESFGRSMTLVSRVHRARGRPEAVRAALEESELEWLEADLRSCPGAIEAVDAVRKADWRPDRPFSLTAEGEGEIILHPAMIRVEMWGAYIRTRYQGWVRGTGLPEAALSLVETLGPCWRPSRTPRPWERGRSPQD